MDVIDEGKSNRHVAVTSESINTNLLIRVCGLMALIE